jgi:hypothetical protein
MKIQNRKTEKKEYHEIQRSAKTTLPQNREKKRPLEGFQLERARRDGDDVFLLLLVYKFLVAFRMMMIYT